MKILMTGSSGLIGSALYSYLESQRHLVTSLVRKPSSQLKREIIWNPENGILDLNSLEGFDAVIHLAGENIMGRWTKDKKDRILKSRIIGTRLLCESLNKLKNPCPLLISASAIGYYGDRGHEVLTERSGKGEGFLSDVCAKWEKEAQKSAVNGVRVVNIRTGMVLSDKGGALKKMLPIFKLGLGGTIGSGNQMVSWIAIDDLLRLIVEILENKNLSGPVNAVAPNPLTNREFTQTLASLLHRPAIFNIPTIAVNLLLGEMGKEVLLYSTRVKPEKILNTGFKFSFSQLSEVLKHLLTLN